MKNLVLYSFVFLFFSCKPQNSAHRINFECSDINACIEFEKKLKLIHDWNFLLKGTSGIVEDAGKDLQRLTGIETTADISFAGLNPPTIQDYENWSIWYVVNHNCLKYDIEKLELRVDKDCVKENLNN